MEMNSGVKSVLKSKPMLEFSNACDCSNCECKDHKFCDCKDCECIECSC